MQGAESLSLDLSQMPGGTVTLVTLEIKPRILPPCLSDPAIATDLRQDRRGSDGLAQLVPSNDRPLGCHAIRNREPAIDEQKLGLGYQLEHREPHRLERGVMDVDPVYLCGIDHCDPPRDRLLQDDLEEPLPDGWAQFFGIINTGNDMGGRQDHRRRKDRAGQAPTPHLIDPSDGEDPALQEPPLMQQEVSPVRSS